MTTQPFRAGDVVEVRRGLHKGEHWVVAVYDAQRDEAYIAGWPCTCVANASMELRLFKPCDDAEHARMIEAVGRMRGHHGFGDPRSAALALVLERGGTP